MNSIKMSGSKNLAKVPVTRLRRFLEEVANLEGFVPGCDHTLISMLRLQPELMRESSFQVGNYKVTDSSNDDAGLNPEVFQAAVARLRKKYPELDPTSTDLVKSMEILEPGIPDPLFLFCSMVRAIWVQPDWRTKQYNAFLLWRCALLAGGKLGSSRTDYFPERLPPPSGFEQAVKYLLDAADLTRYCVNPDCQAPYFFAVRRSQKYCSDLCAKPAQRAQKRQWWAEHGGKWLGAYKAKQVTKQKGKPTKNKKNSEQSRKKGN